MDEFAEFDEGRAVDQVLDVKGREGNEVGFRFVAVRWM